MKSILDTLVCPKCKNNLIKLNEIFICRICNLEYTMNDGIYDFLGDINSFYSELSIEEMNKILNIAEISGWRTAVREIGLKYPFITEVFLNNTRVDWLFHCLDLSKTGSCLELGSGWGTTVFCLARYFDEVWSFDSIKQRLEFQRIRQNQDKIKNIKFGRTSLLSLPFQDNYFDLVATKNYMNGLNFKNNSNTRKDQLGFLKEIRRILKPGGCLYIGSPNGIKFTSFFHKNNSNVYLFTDDLSNKNTILNNAPKFKQNDIINNELNFFNYSYYGFKKILKEAGFSNIEFYWTLDFNRPEFSGRIDGKNLKCLLYLIQKNSIVFPIENSLIKSSIISIGAHLPDKIIKYALTLLSPSFLIYAYKDYKTTTFESKLLNLEPTASSFITRSGFYVRGEDSKIIYFFIKNGRPYSLIKFPRFRGFESLISEEEKLSRFNHLDIKRKDTDSIIVFVEPFLKGESMDYYNPSHYKAALNWLLDFQKQTQQGFWDFNQFETKVLLLSNYLSEIPIDNEIRLRTKEKLKSFLKTLSDIKLPQNYEHGDFFAVNILIDDNKVYVTDWEFFNEKGDPLFDFVFFILCCFSHIKPTPKAFLDAFHGKGEYAGILKYLILEFCKEKKIPVNLILEAVPYVLLRCIYRTTFKGSQKQLDPSGYIFILEVWDKINLSSAYNFISTS